MTSWDVFWFLFVFIPLCILWGAALFDLMGRRDLVGWKKAIWVVVIIFFPWIGVLAYLILRPREVAQTSYAGAPVASNPASTSAPAYAPPAAQASPAAVPTQISQVSGDAHSATT